MAKNIIQEELHPKLQGLPIHKEEIKYYDLKYSGDSDQWIVVPTEFVIENILDHDLWKGCPPLVNWDILKCIEAVVERGDYPYNTSVGDEFCKRFNCGKYTEHSFLSVMVYCTQSYRGVVKHEKAAKELNDKAISEGYFPNSKDLLEDILTNNRKCLVILEGTNVIGGDTIVKNEKPMRLIKDAAGTLFFMPPRCTRKGYYAEKAKYVKII